MGAFLSLSPFGASSRSHSSPGDIRRYGDHRVEDVALRFTNPVFTDFANIAIWVLEAKQSNAANRPAINAGVRAAKCWVRRE